MGVPTWAVRIKFITYNMGNEFTGTNELPRSLRNPRDDNYDIYVVSTQEQNFHTRWSNYRGTATCFPEREFRLVKMVEMDGSWDRFSPKQFRLFIFIRINCNYEAEVYDHEIRRVATREWTDGITIKGAVLAKVHVKRRGTNR